MRQALSQSGNVVFIAEAVDASFAAARAGIQPGNMLHSYNLDPLESRVHTKWADETLRILDAAPQGDTFLVRVRSTNLPDIYQRRRIYAGKRKRINPGALDRLLSEWDRKHAPVSVPAEPIHEADDFSFAAPVPSRESDDDLSLALIPVPDLSLALVPVSVEPSREPDGDLSLALVSMDAEPTAESNAQLIDDLLTAMQQSEELEEPEDEYDFDYGVEQVPEVGSTTHFYQFKGPNQVLTLRRGWLDEVENECMVLTEEVITFLCQRFIQLVPYEVMRMHRFQERWIANAPLLTCVPFQAKSRWVLAAVLREPTRNTVFVLDCLNPKVCCSEIKAMKKMIVKEDPDRSIAHESLQCLQVGTARGSGEVLIGNFITLVRFMSNMPSDPKRRDIQNLSFDMSLAREDIRVEIEDGMSESLYHKAYWGQWHFSGDPKHKWWPCRRISKRFAKKLDPLSKASNLVPIIWFNKGKNDAIWINPINLSPITELNLEEVLDMCDFDDLEVAQLRESYEEAMR